jgi:hypothetical protein
MNQQEYNGKLWKFIINAVHPDINPEMRKIDNKIIGERVDIVMNHKNDEPFLVKKAVIWGIKLPSNIVDYYKAWKKFNYGIDVIFKGNFVDVLYTKHGDKVYFSGWIVDIQFEMATRKKVIYFVTENDIIKIIKVTRENEEIIRSEDIEHPYNEYQKAAKVFQTYKKNEKSKEAKKIAKEKRDKYKEMFKKVGLKPVTEYKYDCLNMEYNGVTYRVVKTTTNKVVLSYIGILIKIRIEDATRVKY